MAARENSPVAEPAQRELIMSRVFNAPRSLVFKAWTDPKRLAQWWGPRGFTNPVCDLDVRPGGKIRVDMTGPDGMVHPMGGSFQEIVEPERIIFLSTAFEDAAGNAKLKVHNTVLFEDLGKQTRVSLHAVVLYASPDMAFALAGMEQGWRESLQKLTETLATDREIVAVRMFNAPPEIVWRMWTDPQHLAQWWGPNGFTNTIQQMDVRPGGQWRHIMHGPDGRTYPNECVYSDVAKPKRLGYDHLSDPRFKVTVSFVAVHDQTEITMRMVFESAALRKKVVDEHRAVEGLHQTLSRLAQHLSGLARNS